MPNPVTSVPSIRGCFQLMSQYRMLPNIKEHSIVVARITFLIVRALQDAGKKLSIETAVAGALLHDIGKTPCLNTNKDHALEGQEICLAEDLVGIADIVASHILLKDYSPNSRLSEKVIVYYADKRVNHDQVVSLEERLAYILSWYGRHDENLRTRIRKNFNKCLAIEKRIFSPLDFRPFDVQHLISDIEINPA